MKPNVANWPCKPSGTSLTTILCFIGYLGPPQLHPIICSKLTHLLLVQPPTAEQVILCIPLCSVIPLSGYLSALVWMSWLFIWFFKVEYLLICFLSQFCKKLQRCMKLFTWQESNSDNPASWFVKWNLGEEFLSK